MTHRHAVTHECVKEPVPGDTRDPNAVFWGISRFFLVEEGCNLGGYSIEWWLQVVALCHFVVESGGYGGRWGENAKGG